MQPVGHFYSKFAEEWEATLTKIQKEMDDPELKKEFADSCRVIRAVEEEGSHWVLSSDAFSFVWRTDIHSADFNNTRLPFPYMVVEYRFDYDGLGYDRAYIGEGRSESPERFVVLAELDDDKVLLLSGFHLDPDIDSDLPLRWVLSPSALVLPYKSIENLSDWMTPVPGGIDVDLTKDFVQIVPSLPVYRSIDFNKYSPEQRRDVITDLFDELRVALALLAILSCNNAPVAEIKAPEKLNKKRVKAGKRPLPDYRTLHITSHESRPHHGTGTHASPRTHWRRGHIRNQPTAKGIVRKWIRPAIVNAGDTVPHKPEVVLT